MSSWILRRDQLDPDQKRIVDAPINNMWISGFAGSGKSVILVHKALSILEADPSAKIVFVVYTNSLVDLFKTGLMTLGYNDIEVKTIYGFMSENDMYDYVFCDEVQDFTDSMICEIRRRTRRNIIVAGDKFQSIYEQDVRFKQPTIDPQNALPRYLSVHTEELAKIYRLTPSIIDAIDHFLPSMRIVVNSRCCASKIDVSIKLCTCFSRCEEAVYSYDNAERYIAQSKRTAVLFSQYKDCIEFVNFVLKDKGRPQWEEVSNRYGKPDFESLNKHLADNGIKLMYVGNGYGSLKEAEDKSVGVMMTYLSSKGLDFENVYLPFADSNIFPIGNDSRNRTVFMVAMSRCSTNLTITYSGQLCQYVSAFRGLCTQITPSAQPQVSQDDFDF